MVCWVFFTSRSSTPHLICEPEGKNKSFYVLFMSFYMDSARQGTQRRTGEMGKSEGNPEALRSREKKNATQKVFGRAVRCSWQKVLQG